jgi:putative transposase
MGNLSRDFRMSLIEINSKMSIEKQCNLLSIAKSSFYYEPVSESEFNLKLMLEMDKIHLKRPFYGVIRMTFELKTLGFEVNEKRVRRLMRKMGLEAIYCKPNLSKPMPNHHKFPYLLRNLSICKPNQVWSIDITYVPMKNGFLYLVATIDWYSKFILSWELSNSLEVNFCLKMLTNAYEKFGTPQIINTDQGSQFTCNEFVSQVLSYEIQLSMDGKGRATDNIAIERFWRSIKYEDIYLYSYENGKELHLGIEKYVYFYNNERPHQGIENQFPAKLFAKK